MVPLRTATETSDGSIAPVLGARSEPPSSSNSSEPKIAPTPRSTASSAIETIQRGWVIVPRKRRQRGCGSSAARSIVIRSSAGRSEVTRWAAVTAGSALGLGLGRRRRAEQLLELGLGPVEQQLARRHVLGRVAGLALHPGDQPLQVAALREVQRQQQEDADRGDDGDDRPGPVDHLGEVHAAPPPRIRTRRRPRRSPGPAETRRPAPGCRRRSARLRVSPSFGSIARGELGRVALRLRLEHDDALGEPRGRVGLGPDLVAGRLHHLGRHLLGESRERPARRWRSASR